MSEIYPHATVKEVAFEIKFPSLLFIENKIGDYQLKIMNEFPESQEIIQQQFIISSTEIDKKDEDNRRGIKKIWQFKSVETKGYTLKVTTDSISISSTSHKTYNNPKEENKFRDVIKACLDPFLEMIPLQVIKRIGLRYIDYCPLPKNLSNSSYQLLYKTALALNRFSVEDSRCLYFQGVIKKGDIFLRYVESFDLDEPDERKLLMDFDAYKNDISALHYLEITDTLYQTVHNEWENSINDPFRDYMRTGEMKL